MACSIASEDLLAICLVLADGDLSLDTGEVMRRAIAFQQERGSHLGTCESDLFLALVWLGLTSRLWRFGPTGDPVEMLQRVVLGQWVEPILAQRDVWLDEDGEDWTPWGRDAPSERNAAWRAFFAAHPDPAPAEVRDWLASEGWSRERVASFLASARADTWQ
jgi:hypothetical protein